MSEETRKLWDLVKNKISTDGLRDVVRYHPELSEEVELIIEDRKIVNNSD